MIVNTNLYSYSPQRSLSNHTQAAFTAMERLATGTKINSAKDDVAGFAIAERMTSEVRGLSMAVKNANDALGMLSVADTAADDITDMLQRARELAVQAASDTNSASDRQNLQKEADSLFKEIDRVATQTQYNGENLLDGTKKASIQIGSQANQTTDIAFRSFHTSSFDPVLKSITSTQSTSGPNTDLTKPVLTSLTKDKSVVDVTNGSQTVEVNFSVLDDSKISSAQVFFRHKVTQKMFYTSANIPSAGIDGGSIPPLVLNFTQNQDAGIYEFWHISITDIKGNRAQLFQNDIGSGFQVEVVGGGIAATTNNQSYSWSQAASLSGSSSYTPTGTASQSYSWSQTASLSGSSAYTATGAASQSYKWSLYNFSSLNITDTSSPINAIASIDAAIEAIMGQRAEHGALQNRLHYTISNLMNVGEQTTAARSRLTDTDYAVESVNLIKAQVLQQGAAAMVAQAQAVPELVLSLIR